MRSCNDHPTAAAAIPIALATGLPFVNIARWPPLPSFWAEWLAVALWLAWTVFWMWRGRRDDVRIVLTPLAAALLALAVLTLLQIGLGGIRYPTEALVAVALMVAAAAVNIAGRSAAMLRIVLITGWCWGIVGATAANGAGVLMQAAGWEWVGLQLLPTAPLYRPAGLVGQANHLGMLAVLCIACTVYLRSVGSLGARACVAVVAMCTALTAVSGSRVALLAFAVIALLALMHARVAHTTERLVQPRTLMAGVAAFVFVQVGWALAMLALADADHTVARLAFSGRPAMIRDAFELLALHPLLGVGWGNYAGARLLELQGSLPSAQVTHAHNLYAQVFAEWGLFGGIAVVLASVSLALSVLRRDVLATRLGVLVAAVGLSLLAHSLVEHPLWFSYFLLPVAFLIGVSQVERPLTRVVAMPTPSFVATLGVSFTAGLGLVAIDYARTQELAIRLVRSVELPPSQRPALEEFVARTQTTLLPTFPDLMLARKIDPDPLFVQAKLDVAKRAMCSQPVAETIATYTLLLAVAGDFGDARNLLAMIESRNDVLHAKVRDILEANRDDVPALAPLLRPADGS